MIDKLKVKRHFRIAINNAKSLTEARAIDRIRSKYFANQLDHTGAILAWLEVTLRCDPTRGVPAGRMKYASTN